MSGAGRGLSFWIPATTGAVFASGAFDSQIGKTIRVNFGGFGEEGRLLAAVVDPDGRGARLTIEAPFQGSP